MSDMDLRVSRKGARWGPAFSRASLYIGRRSTGIPESNARFAGAGPFVRPFVVCSYQNGKSRKLMLFKEWQESAL